MKITLISPYSSIYAFGLRTISACLKEKGHRVTNIFLVHDFLKKYHKRVLDETVNLCSGSDLIGFSLTTNFFANTAQITERIKSSQDIPVIWGGIHPTIKPEECLEYADIVCIGEGEATLLELVDRIENSRDYSDVLGLWFKDKGCIIKNNIRPLINDLDSIPFQDYDYDMHYILDKNQIKQMSPGLIKKYTGGAYMSMPTRGCPFGCAYCCNNTLNKMYRNNGNVRKRSTDNIIRELVLMKAKLLTMGCVYFDDDAFFSYSFEEMRQFCKEYKANVGLPLIITGATPLTLTREKLSLLVDAGLFHIRMGIQTANERIKTLYRRNHSNQQVKECAKIINEFSSKIRLPQYDIILDNPWENDKELIETLRFLVTLPQPYNIYPYSLTFYPFTELYEKAKKQGIIKNELKDIYLKNFRMTKKTYLNRIFWLLKLAKGKIPPQIMSLLTNKTAIRLKLGWLLYALLYIIFKASYIKISLANYKILFIKGIITLKNRDYERIIRYLKNT